MIFSFEKRSSRILGAIAIILAMTVVLFPFLWIFIESIKPPSLGGRPDVWRFDPSWDNWSEIALNSDVPFNILNSFMIALTTVMISLVCGAPAAYAFSRFQGFQGARYSILAAEMMPPAILILPLFLVLFHLKLIDSRIGVIFTHLTFVLPVVTWFLIGFFDKVPRDLENQAMIDGYTRFQAFYKVILPAVRPGLGAAGVFGFVLSWNDLFYALLLTGTESRTLPVAIAGFWTFRGIELGKMAVAILIAVIPVLILSYSIQKHLIRGIGGSGVKF
jgi:ABC-type glycerol-3-phosphate transport system permease component